MDLDLIAQHAATIEELYKQYAALLKEKEAQLQQGRLNPKLEENRAKIRTYILQLADAIQTGIDEERENVYS